MTNPLDFTGKRVWDENLIAVVISDSISLMTNAVDCQLGHCCCDVV